MLPKLNNHLRPKTGSKFLLFSLATILIALPFFTILLYLRHAENSVKLAVQDIGSDLARGDRFSAERRVEALKFSGLTSITMEINSDDKQHSKATCYFPVSFDMIVDGLALGTISD